MRNLFVTFVVLLGCLFVAQSTTAATAVYGACCIEGCKGMSNCVGASCPVCTPPASATEPAAPRIAAPADEKHASANERGAASAFAEIWNPPD